MRSPESLFEELVERILEYNSQSKLKLIKKAYNFARNAHEWQTRKSWEPYIIHPLCTAINITKLQADDISIISCLLHDVPEDTKKTIQEIENEFGKEVAFIVDWVTKLSKVYYKNNMEWREVEYLRKLFMSAWWDIRVIFIKICDRFHNMQTLDYVSKEKQQRIARETIEIYVPIIQLLSIWEFMWTIEDLCLKYIDEKIFHDLYKNFWIKKDIYNEKIQNIKKKVIEEIEKRHINGIEITWRTKNLYSIYKKIITKDLILDQVQDIMALRIITTKKEDCYLMLWIIHCLYKVKWWDRFKDYISSPKINWYQAIHTTVFDRDWDLVEFQIQTQDMLKLNTFWLAAHYIYKNITNWHYKDTPYWIKNILEIQKDNPKWWDFINLVKDEILSTKIVCFTPIWEKIELPLNATLFDFAFKLKTSFGQYFSCAYINWHLENNPLHTLRQWDIINLIKDSKNYEFDLNHIAQVKTNLAVENIKKILKLASSDKRIKLWKYILNNKLEILWYSKFWEIPLKNRKTIISNFNLIDENDLYNNVWIWNINISQILKLIPNIYDIKNIWSKKVTLKIFLKVMDYKTRLPIVELFTGFDIKIYSSIFEEKYFKIIFFVENQGQLEDLIAELERTPNVWEILRVYPVRLILLNLLSFLIWIFILMSPYLLQNLNKIHNIIWDEHNLASNIIIITEFWVMILLVHFFEKIAKITLPWMVNSRAFWIWIFILNTYLLWVILWFISHNEAHSYNNLLIIWLSIVMYTTVILEYVNFRKKQKNKYINTK